MATLNTSTTSAKRKARVVSVHSDTPPVKKITTTATPATSNEDDKAAKAIPMELDKDGLAIPSRMVSGKSNEFLVSHVKNDADKSTTKVAVAKSTTAITADTHPSDEEDKLEMDVKEKSEVTPNTMTVEVSVARLQSQKHSLQMNIHMILQYTGFQPTKNITSILKNLTNWSFKDRFGSPIQMQLWDDGLIDTVNPDGNCYGQNITKHLKVGNWYKVTYFEIKQISERSRNFNKHAASEIYTLGCVKKDKQNKQKHPFTTFKSCSTPSDIAPLHKINPILNIAALLNMTKDASTPLQIVAIVCYKQDPATYIDKKTGLIKYYLTISFADDSDYRIPMKLWESAVTNCKLAVGDLVLLDGCVLRSGREKKGLVLANGNIQIIDPKVKDLINPRVAVMQKWVRANPNINFACFTDLGFVAPTAPSPLALKTIPFVLIGQLIVMQKKAQLVMQQGMDEARKAGMIVVDQYNNEIIPKELRDKMPNGKFRIVANVHFVMSRQEYNAGITVNKNRSNNNYCDVINAYGTGGSNVLYPACPNPIHGLFRCAVKYQPNEDDWLCNKCHKRSKTCEYGSNVKLVIYDNDSITVTHHRIEQFLPPEISIPQLIADVRHIEHGTPANYPIDPQDHLTYNTGILLSLEQIIVHGSPQDRMFVLDAEPDALTGIQFKVNRSYPADNYEERMDHLDMIFQTVTATSRND